MKKAFVIIFAVILLLGVSGCGSLRAAYEKPNPTDVVNASSIATAINAIHDLRMKRMDNVPPLHSDTTLEDAKGYGSGLWPYGLSDEEEKAAWLLIEIKDGEAELVSKAAEEMRVVAKYAYIIAHAVSAYNDLYPGSTISRYNKAHDKTTLEEAKEAVGEEFWPKELSKEEEKAAWGLIVIYDLYNAVELIPDAERALYGKITANAVSIVKGINQYALLNGRLSDNATLEDVKLALGRAGIWPPLLLNDVEVSKAWELVEIKAGRADLTPEAREALQAEIGDNSNDAKNANASIIAEGINAHNALNPCNMLSDNVTLAEVKEILDEACCWPLFLSNAEAAEAWELIEIKDGVATVKRKLSI